MPQLTRTFSSDDLPPTRIRQLYESFSHGRLRAATIRSRFRLQRGDDTWILDLAADFFAELDSGPCEAEFREDHDDAFLEMARTSERTTITIRAPRRELVDQLFNELGQRGVGAPDTSDPLRVFLGHGRDHQWRALRDHLHEHPGIVVLTYEGTSEVGDPARVVLEQLTAEAEVAVVLHTAEVRGAQGWDYAVPNVIHETGLFQGVLGWQRTLIVREDRCRPLSNTAGLTEVRFTDGNVREAFGDVVAFLRTIGRHDNGPPDAVAE